MRVSSMNGNYLCITYQLYSVTIFSLNIDQYHFDKNDLTFYNYQSSPSEVILYLTITSLVDMDNSY